MTTDPAYDAKSNPQGDTPLFSKKVDSDAGQEAEKSNNTQREPFPIEFREFTVSIRELFREIKKFIVFVRNRKNTNAALVFLTFLLAIAAFTQAIIYGIQIGPLRQSAEAAKNAADTARDALVLSNRPWIKIKHRIVKPLNFDFVGAAGPAATMTVEDTLENVGNSVALNVVSWEDVIPIDPDFSTTSARKRRDDWCNANKWFDPKSHMVLNGTTMFPKDPLVQASHMGPLMSAVDKAVEANMEPLKQFVSPAVPNTLLGKVQFVMVGCVVYRSSFEPDGTRPHMTGFLYHLGEPQEVGIQPFITPKGTAGKLQLVKFPDGDIAY